MKIDINKWYEKYGPMVFRRCQRLLGDEASAKDAMQEVFLRVLKNQNRLKETYPSTLLYKIATQVSLNMIRTKKRHMEVMLVDDALLQIADHFDNDEKIESRTILARIFGRTPMSTRMMAVLHYVDGLTLKEVSKESGLSVSGVRRRLRQLKIEAEKIKEKVYGP